MSDSARASSESARWRRARATATSSPITPFGSSPGLRWLSPCPRTSPAWSEISRAVALVLSPVSPTDTCTRHVLGPWVLRGVPSELPSGCLLYTSDAADEEDSVDLGG